MIATQFVFPHPYFDMVCNRLTDFDYRVQYKRLTELEVWLAHCVQEDIRVQISPSDVALLLGEWK